MLLSTCGQLFIVLLFISRRLQTQLEAFKTAEAASKQTKVFIVLFSLFDFFFYIRGQFEKGNLNLKCCLKIDMFKKLNRVFSRGTKHDVNCLI